MDRKNSKYSSLVELLVDKFSNHFTQLLGHSDGLLIYQTAHNREDSMQQKLSDVEAALRATSEGNP